MDVIKSEYRGFTIREYSKQHVIQYYKIQYRILVFPKKYSKYKDCTEIIDESYRRVDAKKGKK